jgi:hypothetical protein
MLFEGSWHRCNHYPTALTGTLVVGGRELSDLDVMQGAWKTCGAKVSNKYTVEMSDFVLSK